MAFTLTRTPRKSPGMVLLAAAGEANAVDFPADNHMHFDTLLGPDWSSNLVLLDMDKVPYIESAAIGWMIRAQKLFRLGGGLLVLHSVQPHIRNMLDMLKFDRVVPLAADETTGQKLLSSLAEMEQTV